MQLYPASISGVIVPLVTPRHFEDFCPLLDHVVDGGVSAVFILGTTGETLKLDQKQRIEVIMMTVKHLRNRVSLLVGVSAGKLAESLELMHLVDEVGATGVVIPHLWGGDGMNAMEELITSTRGNFVLYNNPALTTDRFLPIELVKRLALEKRILGIKDSSGDLEYFSELLKVKRHPNFKIYYGPERHYLQILNKGIDGIVSASANLNPHLLSELWQKKGEGVWPQWEALRDAVKQAGSDNYLLGLKLLLKQRGLLTHAGLW